MITVRRILNTPPFTLATSTQVKWLVKGFIGLAGLATLWYARQPITDVLALVGDREAIIAYLGQFGWWGPALLFITLCLQVVVAAIPGHFLMIAGGYLYGPVGFLVSLVSTVGASQAAFGLARWAGRPLVERLAPAHVLDRWNQAAEKRGFVFFLFSFWLPIFPSDVMNFVAGLSSIRGRQFFLANLLGRLPGVMLLTSLGMHQFRFTPQVWGMIIAGGLGLFLLWRYVIAGDDRPTFRFSLKRKM